MKKLSKILVFSVLAVFLLAGSAMATPIFNGDPLASFGTGDKGLPTNPLGPGYYIWANDEARTSWSVRWTGKDWVADTSEMYEWTATIEYSTADGILDAVEVLWDPSDGEVNIIDKGGYDLIDLTYAFAGSHWDGFDFNLQGSVGNALTFTLYTDFHSRFNRHISSCPDDS